MKFGSRLSVGAVVLLFSSSEAASAQILLPPAPLPQPQKTGAQVRTESELSRSQGEDSGIGLEWVYVGADAGFSWVGLSALGQTDLGLEKKGGAGFVWGAGVGARLLWLSIGARVRNHQLADFSLWTVGGEAAWHAKFGHWDPFAGLRVSYATLGSIDAEAFSAANQGARGDFALRGFNFEFAGGADYYCTSLISVGAELGIAFWFLKRPQLTTVPTGASAADVLYTKSGSASALGISSTAHLALHF